MRVIKLNNDLKAITIDYDKNIPQFSHNQVILTFAIPILTYDVASIVYQTSSSSGEDTVSGVQSNDSIAFTWGVPQSATLYSGELKVWLALKSIDANDEITKSSYSSTIKFNIVKGELGGEQSEPIELSAEDLEIIQNSVVGQEIGNIKTLSLDNDLKLITPNYDKNVPQFSHNQCSIKIEFPTINFDATSIIYKTRVTDMEQYISATIDGDKKVVVWNVPQSATLYAGEVKFWLVLKSFTGTQVDSVVYSAPLVLNIVKGEIGSEVANTEVSSNTITEIQEFISESVSDLVRIYYNETLPSNENVLKDGDLYFKETN